MPLQTAQKQLQRDGVRGFLGVNLRSDRTTLADGYFAHAVNADLHRRPGVALLRLGRTNQFSTSLGATIRRLAKHNGIRYQVAGTVLYANQTSILTGLHTDLVTTLHPFRTLNDTSEWVYIADRSAMKAYDGTTVRNWGITAPAAVATIAAGSGTGLYGDYTAVYTYARVVGTAVATESSPSATPAAVTLTNTDLNVTVVASTDAQVTNIRIYRTVAGGTLHLFDQQVANSAATIASTQADSALGAAVETDNARPNVAAWVTAFQGHLFTTRDTTNPHYLWWSRRFREEVPTDQFIEIGNPSDPLQGAFALAGFLGVFSRLTKYRVVGNQTSGFVAVEALNSRGTPAAHAATITSRGVLFPARDGLFLTNFLEDDTELSTAIESLFYERTSHDFAPIDWSKTNEMATAEYKDRLYFSYPDTDGNNLLAVYSMDTERWYHFDYGTDMRALYVEEDVDDLVGGGTAGLVYVLEDSAQSDDNNTNITMRFEPATKVGIDRDIHKLFQYLICDIEAQSGTVTVTLYVDDVAVRSYAVTGSRTRRLLRLPARLMGFTWRVGVDYAGQEQIEVHGFQVLYLPLRYA